MITGDYLKTAIAIARLLLQCLWSGFASPLVDLRALHKLKSADRLVGLWSYSILQVCFVFQLTNVVQIRWV